jgi:hypothetical protein
LHRSGNSCYNLDVRTRGENGSLHRDQGGLLYKAPLTATVFKDFSACYQHFSSQNSQNLDQPFVYVDSDGVKLVTGVVDEEHSATEGVFAVSVAGDGWVEMLAMYEAG